MNRIDQLFKKKNRNVISVYFTAGYPRLNDTRKIIEHLEQQGADMIEVGIPFSDPLADGPVIQKSSKAALENGMSLKLLFYQLNGIRSKVKIPLLFMSYLNPVMQFGFSEFCRTAAATGIDGLIIPDLPPEIYERDFKEMMELNNLRNIMLVSPTTRQERLRNVLKQSKGFVYMVSSNSTTGNDKDVSTNLEFVSRIKEINQDVPVMVGFGIDSREKIRKVNHFANGAIIGSYFIKSLNGDLQENIETFMNRIKP